MKSLAKRHIGRVIILVVLAMTFSSCTQKKSPQTSILPKGCQLMAGDVVFRRGGGMTSYAVLVADPEGNYSHVGIVAVSAGKKIVIHAVPGEPDYQGDSDRVKADTPEQFFSTLYASRGAICRHKDPAIAANAARLALKLFREHILFDHDYNLKDTTRMYCTELLAYVYSRAGSPLVSDTCGHNINLPGLHARCLLPSDIYQSARLKHIKSF